MTAAGHSAAIETNTGGGIGGRMTGMRTTLRTILDVSRNVFVSREMIVGPQRARPSEWRRCKRIGLSWLSASRTFFPQRDSHCWPNDQKEHLQRAAFAVAREHSVWIRPGEVMAADLHRADAQPDITGCVLGQEPESLHSRASIEDTDMFVSCGLTSVVQAELCSEGAS